MSRRRKLKSRLRLRGPSRVKTAHRRPRSFSSWSRSRIKGTGRPAFRTDGAAWNGSARILNADDRWRIPEIRAPNTAKAGVAKLGRGICGCIFALRVESERPFARIRNAANRSMVESLMRGTARRCAAIARDPCASILGEGRAFVRIPNAEKRSRIRSGQMPNFADKNAHSARITWLGETISLRAARRAFVRILNAESRSIPCIETPNIVKGVDVPRGCITCVLKIGRGTWRGRANLDVDHVIAPNGPNWKHYFF